MKKSFFFLCILTSFVFVSSISAAPMVYEHDEGQYYSTPYGWTTLASYPEEGSFTMGHGAYYEWGIEDLPDSYIEDLTSIRIVFHDIHNWKDEDDILNVYIKNGASSYDWIQTGEEWGEWDITPNWDNPLLPDYLGYKKVDDDGWGDPNGGYHWTNPPTYDVVFETDDPIILAYITGTDGFMIGIDPDCHYYSSKVTVEVPIPEPATMLLFGFGLIGLAGLGRKKFLT